MKRGMQLLLAFEAVTGCYLFAFEQPSRQYLAWLMAHLGAGLVTAALLLVRYAFWERRLAAGLWKSKLQRSSSASLALLCLSGIVLLVCGASGVGRAAVALHIVSAAVFLSAVTIQALRWLSEILQDRSAPLLVSRRLRVSKVFLFALICLSTGLVFAASRYSDHLVRRYNFKFGSNPFAPGQAQTAGGGFIPADRFIHASYCARCHPGAHQQWLQSAHRNSFREPFYKKNVELLIEQYGIEVTRHCESCHNPIALVSGALTTGVALPRPFDEEGVTCTVCHSITQVTSLEGIGSYELAPPVLLAGDDGSALHTAVNDRMILLKPELHKRAMMKDLYRKPEFCAACHKSALPREVESYQWRRAFSTYDEWQTSSHSNESVLPFYKKPRNTCQTCHMASAPVARDMAAKSGKLASHRWAAANTAIPFYYGFREQLAAVTEFLQRQVLDVDIFFLQKGAAQPTQRDATDLITLRKGAAGPRLAEGFTTIEAVNAALYSASRPAPPLLGPIEKSEFAITPGETVTAGVVIANTGAGHLFPTELRDFFEPWVEFKVEQGDSTLVYHSGLVTNKGYVDENAHVFQAVQVTEAGDWVRRHNIWETRGKAYDNFIAPGRSELVRYEFTIPNNARGPLRLTAHVRYRRFNRFYSDWVLGKSLDYPIVDMASKTITLQLGQNRPQSSSFDERDKIRFNNLGIALFDQFLFPEAKAAFQKASQIDPRYADAYVNQAIADFRSEKFHEMDALLSKALDVDPENSRARYYRGVLLRMQNRPAQAAENFRRLLPRFPRDRFVWNQLGECYLAMDQLEAARLAFETTLQIDPDDITALYFALEVYRKLKLQDLAQHTNAVYLDKFEDWKIHYLANDFLSRNGAARGEAVPWHVHSDARISTPTTAGPVYWSSEGASAVKKSKR